jgi:uncharacterized membrane protein YfcA
MRTLLLVTLGVFASAYISLWITLQRHRRNDETGPRTSPTATQLIIGFFTNFFDTLGVGSFAPTTSIFKLARIVPDSAIPGTLNVGHTLPTILEAFIFISIIHVDVRTLILMIFASVLGAWIGAGVVSGWPERTIRIGLGLALAIGAALMLATQRHILPTGGSSEGLSGIGLVAATGANFALGALMQLGIGLYAPCMILVSLLGMDPKTAFPIMMGSCAFLMPVGSVRFIRSGRYRQDAALGLSLGGIPAVLLAALLVKSLPLNAVRWLVILVVLYTAVSMLRSAFAKTSPQRAIRSAT